MREHDDELVKLRLKFKPADDLPASEGLWATPVQAHEGGGTYRLDNSSFMVPLAAGDVVRAELDGDGVYQVVDFVEPCPMLLTVTQSRIEDAQPMIDGWAASGAVWTEGTNGLLYTVWREGMAEEEVALVLSPDLDAARIQWLSTAPPDERTRAALADDVDFELDTVEHFPPVQTDYWAAEDPYWTSIGKDDPEFLAFVQHLASDDARVARALERGQQDRVLLYISRITAEDPRSLPPLDGPIFDPE